MLAKGNGTKQPHSSSACVCISVDLRACVHAVGKHLYNGKDLKKKNPLLEKVGWVGVTDPHEPRVVAGFCLGRRAESERSCARGLGGSDPAGCPMAGC